MFNYFLVRLVLLHRAPTDHKATGACHKNTREYGQLLDLQRLQVGNRSWATIPKRSKARNPNTHPHTHADRLCSRSTREKQDSGQRIQQYAHNQPQSRHARHMLQKLDLDLDLNLDLTVAGKRWLSWASFSYLENDPRADHPTRMHGAPPDCRGRE